MHQMLRFIVTLAFALPSLALAQADLRQPSGKEWLTIGGDWSNSRYSTLTQINRENVKNLKAAWVVHLGSGLGTKYSHGRHADRARTASCTSPPATTTSSRSTPGPAR